MSKRFKPARSNMSLERIRVQNFKSFQSLDMSLDRFNVVIGANASGKSNLAQVFEFLSDIVADGLDGAISRQGGMEYLLNFANPGSGLSYEITLSLPANSMLFLRLKELNSVIAKVVYRFEIHPENGSRIKITDDVWRLSVDMSNGRRELPPLEIAISNENGRLKIHMDHAQDDQLPEEVMEIIKRAEKFYSVLPQKPRQLSLEHPIISYISREIGDFCNGIGIYDIDPKAAGLATPVSGAGELEQDGENLAAVLKNIMEREDNQKMLSNIITDTLPFVRSVGTEKLLDNSVILVQKENYFKDKTIPATLISDGTINTIALICALYFQGDPLAIIEEPERNIHPSLMDRVVDMMKDASNNKQIIATTHSTEMIRHVGIENILLIRRNEKGNSEIIKPGNQEEVKEFLENDMDIGDLFAQNMLGD